MAKAYIGADNAAKLVKAMYIGVDGVARKVTKAYRGVDGVAKLVYSEAPEGYLYGGTSTFVLSTGGLVSSKTDYTLTEDKYVLQVEKYDTTPLYVYFDNDLVATVTTEGEQTITLDGWASTLISRGTITVTVTSEGTYGLGEQDIYQFWDYTGSDKNTKDITLHGRMTSATLSDNVIKIWNYALRYLYIDSPLSIPSRGLVTLGDYAFAGVPMSTLVLPETVRYFGTYCFKGCTLASSITIHNWPTEIPTGTFQNCGSLTSITIPNGVTSIGDYAFDGCDNLTSITIPNGVTSIGDYAFNHCEALTSITIPNSVTSIGEVAFNWCDNLTSITIPNSVTSIGDSAFSNCDLLTSITFEHGASDPLSIYVNTSSHQGAFYMSYKLATNVYHNGNASVLNYDWAYDNRTVTFIQL